MMRFRHPAAAFAAGFTVFAVCAALSKLVSRTPVWLPQLTLKSLLVAASFALGGTAVRASFKRVPGAPWVRLMSPGLALGATSTLAALLLGTTGMSAMLKGWTVPQILFFVWFYSSVTEEIFTRGWVQSAMPPGRGRVVTSGLLFGSMHLSLILAGAQPVTVAIIVTGTTLLGLVCAHYRDRYDSLYPAIVAHIGFNVGGLIGGIFYNIGYRVATGKFPLHG